MTGEGPGFETVFAKAITTKVPAGSLIMKKRSIAISLIGLLLMLLLFIRSWANETVWHWIASISIAVLIIQFTRENLNIRLIPLLRVEVFTIFSALFSLILAIISISSLATSSLFLAFFFFFLANYHYRLMQKNKGIEKRNEIIHFRKMAINAAIFSCLCIASYAWPTLLITPLQSLVFFFVLVVPNAFKSHVKHLLKKAR